MRILTGQKPMGEYEDRYPDAYGHGEVIDKDVTERHFTGIGPPRQTRNPEPAAGAPRLQAHKAAAHRERVARPLVARPPQDIRADVSEQLNDSPFIDATGITVTVDGSEVTLEGTIYSLIAIALARALASNIAGVGRVQVRLRVQAAPRTYETAATSAYKVEER
jgi:hypothetical protein